MDITLITGLITGLGVGSGATVFLQYLIKKREISFQSHRQELERRYKVIILLMYAAFDFEDNKTTMRINRPDLQSRESVLQELKAEWYNMLLFASKNTQIALHAFIKNPGINNLKDAAIAMRVDLGRNPLDSFIRELKF